MEAARGRTRRAARRTVAVTVGLVSAVCITLAPPAVASSGLLDRSFGGGAMTFDLGAGDDYNPSILAQPDGKVVFAGITNDDGGQWADDMVVHRLDVNGRLDETFGTDGRVVLRDFDTRSHKAMALQSDGKLVIVGYKPGWSASRSGLVVVRLEESGALDESFQGGRAFLSTPSGDNIEGRAVVVQPDGRIVVAAVGSPDYGNRNSDFALARLNTDGSTDLGFGTDGVVFTDFGGWNVANVPTSVLLQPDGRIVVGGTSSVASFGGPHVTMWFSLARYTPEGALDSSFGDRGTLRTTLGPTPREGYLRAMALQADGKIVAAGGSANITDPFTAVGPSVTLVRYRTDGSLDPSFGTGGQVLTQAPVTVAGPATYPGNAGGMALAIDAQGRLVTGGGVNNFGDGDSGLVRHWPNGTVDASFGEGGWVKSDVAGDRDEIDSLALQADGRIVTAGLAKVNGSQVVAVARYPSFNGPNNVGAWGSNVLWQLGDRTSVDRHTPVTTAGVGAASDLASGIFHSLAVKSDGSVWSWGWNGLGQVGDGTLMSRSAPVRLLGVNGVRSVSAGAYHSLAVDANGKVWAWGWNAYGQVGDDSTVMRLAPVQIPWLSDVVAVAAGAFHSVALKKDGTVWAWGWNALGQLGDGTNVDRHRPVQVQNLVGITSLTSGAHHGLAIEVDGTLHAWGRNSFGQLGDGSVAPALAPVEVPGLTGVTSVAAGFHHSVAVRSDGSVWAWGWNGVGQIGDGSALDRHVPVQVSGLRDVASASAGAFHSLALGSDGQIYGWGFNHFGQLGTNSTLDSHTPVPVLGMARASDVAGGTFSSLATRAG